MRLDYRIFQQSLRLAAYFLPIKTPKIFTGDAVYKDIVNVLDKDNTILIITDEILMKLNLLSSLINELDDNNFRYIIHDKVTPNPTITDINNAFSVYRENKCKYIIALGGGSSIDLAKIVAVKAVKPKMKIQKMKGLLKIRKRIAPLIAIPTTSGTGSETTLASVITNDFTHEKYAITDPSLTPRYAALIPELTINLPPHITSTTGLDALTHAIEAFIGQSNTRTTKKDALYAIKLIKENLYTTYINGNDLKARKNMQLASFYAGKAFTRAYVGNVHSIAHALGGLYKVPHGLANAIILPLVLREYGKKIHKKLAIIADYINLGNLTDSYSEKAEKVILWIEELNLKMNIPSTVLNIEKKDIPLLAQRACNESNPFYPVPIIWNKGKFEEIFSKLKGEVISEYRANNK